MKPNQNQVFVEFKERSVHILDGADGAEFSLDREPNGRISSASKNSVANGLRGFLQRHGAVGQRRALCALPARGVTLRTITLPSSVKREEIGRLLAFQIEAQFPVPPSELAWGYSRLPGRAETGSNGSASPHTPAHNGEPKREAEYLVVAIKRELVDDYSALLSSCGVAPAFTVAALVRAGLTSPPDANSTSFGVLEVGVERSELITMDAHSIPALRVIQWGKNQIDNVDALRPLLPGEVTALFVSSHDSPPQNLVTNLARFQKAQALPVPQGQPGVTAATHALKVTTAPENIVLLGAPTEITQRSALPAHWKWAAAAAVLLLGALSLRYVEAAIFRSQLTGKLNELTTYRKTLPNLEKEVSFLNFIKTNQPPYLDTIAVLSRSAPPGTRFDQLLVVRRGDISVRGSVQDPQGPEKLRTKLIDSGFFSKVVVEEQGPASPQDRNKINFRISAVLKPEATRPILPPDPPPTNKPAPVNIPGAMPVMQSLPPNLPPGVPASVRTMPAGAVAIPDPPQ